MKQKTSLSVFILAAILLLAACAEEEMVTKEEKVSTYVSGEEIFIESCISCHSTDNLTGGSFRLDTDKLQKDYKEKDKLYTFVSSNMPENNPGSLTSEEYEAIVNYLWLHK